MAELVSVSALQPGMVIKRITRQHGPVKIRKSGLVTSEEMVSGLAEMGVQEVEIDPAQTVGLEPPETMPLSKTQQLLHSRRDARHTDHHLSEQFNRTMLLPSAQAVPGMFRVYLRPLLISVVVLLGGFSLGYFAATPDRWWPALIALKTGSFANQHDPAQQHASARQTELVGPEASSQPSAKMQNPAAIALPVVEQPAPDHSPEAVSGEPPSTAESIAELGPQVTGPASQSGENEQLTENVKVVQLSADKATADNEDAPVSEVSPELLQRVEAAMAELDSDGEVSEVAQVETPVDSSVPKVHELPAWLLTELPAMSFSTHMYVSNPHERWVRVNGKRVVEGQYISEDLRLVKIAPQHLILAFRGHEFSMAALTDW